MNQQSKISTRRYLTLMIGTLFCVALDAGAVSLRQAYTDALKNDPSFRSAIQENLATQENKNMARAQLLPNLSASYSIGQNTTDVTSPNGLGGLITTHPQYLSRSAVLQLRQPILNLESTSRYFQALAQVSYANAQFSARQQDLVIRVVSAYVDAQFAEEQVALLTAQRDAYAEQQAFSQRMFERGEAARTDVLEAQAKFDTVAAQLLEAQDNVNNLRAALSAITGTEVNSLDHFIDGFKPRAVEPARFEDWREIALQKNAEIEALRNGVEIQRQEVNRSRSGHAPKIDFVASVSRSESETLNTLNQDAKYRSVGVQVTIPLYSGGYVNASSRQAVANAEKARLELEAKTLQVMVELRKQYNLCFSSVRKIEAFEKAVKSAELSVEATRQSIKAGVRINLDLLNAQQQLFQARRDLAQGRYNYLVSYLKLRNAAGVLEGNDLENLASYFVAVK